MKANELRIGNLLLDRGDKLLRLDYWDFMKPAQRMFIEGSEVHSLTEDLEYCKPIPLTAEWLLRFGFYQSMSWTYAIELKGNLKLVYYLGEKVWSIGFKSYSDFSNLKYVHQIQNLYFALTGEELTYGGGEQ
jgi:hypothetical protein